MWSEDLKFETLGGPFAMVDFWMLNFSKATGLVVKSSLFVAVALRCDEAQSNSTHVIACFLWSSPQGQPDVKDDAHKVSHCDWEQCQLCCAPS